MWCCVRCNADWCVHSSGISWICCFATLTARLLLGSSEGAGYYPVWFGTGVSEGPSYSTDRLRTFKIFQRGPSWWNPSRWLPKRGTFLSVIAPWLCNYLPIVAPSAPSLAIFPRSFRAEHFRQVFLTTDCSLVCVWLALCNL